MSVDADKIYAVIRERLRAQRESLDMTQVKLAELAQVQRTTIANIESGRQNIPIHVVYNICDALGMDIDEVFPKREDVLFVQKTSVEVHGETRLLPPRTAEVMRKLLDQNDLGKHLPVVKGKSDDS